MDLSEITKLTSKASFENDWMKRAVSEPPLIMGAWLKTHRPKKPVILAAEGFCARGRNRNLCKVPTSV